MLQGFLNINKPSGITSATVVGKIKRQFGIKKIGHMGTLDPMASGVLPIAVGKATRCFDYFHEKVKKYIVTFSFGMETDTLDITGKVVKESVIVPSKKEVESVIKTFIGKQLQTPPAFSAKKIQGRAAYSLARAGIVPELKPCEIEITNIKYLEQTDAKSHKLEVTCSGGTYIRSLVRDIAYKLNALAVMTALERTENGRFNIENSITLDEVLSKENLPVISISEVLGYKEIIATDIEAKKLNNGVKVETTLHGLFLIKYENELLGIAEAENGWLTLKTYLKES